MGTIFSSTQLQKAKRDGFLLQNNDLNPLFSVKAFTANGIFTTAQFKALSKIAEKHGTGEIYVTASYAVDIPNIPYEKIERVKNDLTEAQLETKSHGSFIQPIETCEGSICAYSNSRTQRIAGDMFKLFYKEYNSIVLPNSLTISIVGCPTQCTLPTFSDIGIISYGMPVVENEMCLGCGICSAVECCPYGAIHKNKNYIQIDTDKCTHCGYCVGKCHFHVIPEKEKYYRIFLGGKKGPTKQDGTPLDSTFSRKEMYSVVGKAILLYEKVGETKETFGDTINRIGFSTVCRTLMK